MLAGFHVFHFQGSSDAAPVLPGLPVVTFKTCLRTIHFANLDESQSLKTFAGYEVYRAQKAYQFVLEVICGLHSPVIGETEVFGQFKNFWQNTPFTYALQQIFDNAIADAKKIRGQHLTDLGGQSYGSLVRKMITSPTRIAILGSGQFVQDILPWIYKDENTIDIYARNQVSALAIRNKFARVGVNPLESAVISAPVVIVAAPLSSAQIEAQVSEESLVIDLRGESAQDPCRRFARYKDLSTFFKAIEKNQSTISLAKYQALRAIEEKSQQRFNAENLRPFGWEDICVW